MSMIFSDGRYERELQEYLEDSPMGIGSDFKESCFREQWEIKYNNEKKDIAMTTPDTKTYKIELLVTQMALDMLKKGIEEQRVTLIIPLLKQLVNSAEEVKKS
jgi:hypothetical protein